MKKWNKKNGHRGVTYRLKLLLDLVAVDIDVEWNLRKEKKGDISPLRKLLIVSE